MHASSALKLPKTPTRLPEDPLKRNEFKRARRADGFCLPLFPIALDALRHLVTRRELELLRVQKSATTLADGDEHRVVALGVERRAASQPTDTC